MIQTGAHGTLVAMAIRLLHTADWQLGKPFTRFSGDIGAILREERFAVLRRIAALATEIDAAAVLVAGDILESEHTEPRVLRQMLARMRDYSGPWLLLPGNHDPARPGGVWDRFAASGDCPPNVHVLREAVPLTLLDERLVILPAPLWQKHVADDPTAWFEQTTLPAAAVKIGLAHGAVPELLPESAGGTNPIARDRAERAGLDYLALGDWHSARQVGARTWYSGTPEPDDFTKSGIGEVLEITLAASGAPPTVERRRVGRFTWTSFNLKLGQTDDAVGIADRLAALIGSLAAPAETVLRLAVTGHIDLAADAALAAAVDRLAADLRHLELASDGLAILPSDNDLADFAAEPLIGDVAERLRASADPAAPLALRLLAGEWRALERE